MRIFFSKLSCKFSRREVLCFRRLEKNFVCGANYFLGIVESKSITRKAVTLSTFRTESNNHNYCKFFQILVHCFVYCVLGRKTQLCDGVCQRKQDKIAGLKDNNVAVELFQICPHFLTTGGNTL